MRLWLLKKSWLAGWRSEGNWVARGVVVVTSLAGYGTESSIANETFDGRANSLETLGHNSANRILYSSQP